MKYAGAIDELPIGIDSQGDAALGAGKLVGAVVNAIDIIEYLGANGGSCGVTQIARSLNMNRSTCFNILKTLVVRDLIAFDPQSKTYSLGLGLASLARSALDPNDELEAIWPEMSRIANEFQLVVNCWRRAGDKRIILIGRADPETSVRIHMSIGQRLPVLSGSTGRVLLAYGALPADELEPLLSVVRWHRQLSLQELLDEAATVRNQGWAVDDGNFLKGITTVAVPLLAPSGKVEYLVCGTTFEGHLDKDGIRRLGERLGKIGEIHRRARHG